MPGRRGCTASWPSGGRCSRRRRTMPRKPRSISGRCSRPPARPLETLLELGSGGGNNASHLKARFRMTLTDRSPAMLDVSRRLNPECEHVEGDMRTLRLDRRFDAVFVHDAVALHDQRRRRARGRSRRPRVHCEPGGAALFAPDHLRETFQPSTDHGGHDDGVRGLRYLEWTWDPDPSDTTYTVDYAYLLRDARRIGARRMGPAPRGTVLARAVADVASRGRVRRDGRPLRSLRARARDA